jgi:phosphoribosylaminoimidazole-succinocarboxamide synthase
MVLKETNFKDLGKLQRGKVRDVYVQEDRLIIISTDRHSSFDRIIAYIPHKGAVLNRMSKFWFEKTRDIIQNHAIAFPHPRVTVAHKCSPLPIEVIVRAYITGVTNTSLWTLYRQGQRDFGSFTLEDGLKKNQKLPKPVITPTTKVDCGDENISAQAIIEQGLIDKNIWQQIEEVSIALFERGQKICAKSGYILADTKYEFGLNKNAKLTLIDEIHTPDSSRFWLANSYEARFKAGLEPESFDKESLRIWFKEHCDPYHDAILPEAPEDLIRNLSEKYIKIYEETSGCSFDRNEKLNQPV